MLDILDARAYARAKQQVETKSLDELPPGDYYVEMVWEMQLRTAKEVRAERTARVSGDDGRDG